MAISNDIVARATADLQRAEAAASRAREALARAEAEVADLSAFLRTLERYAAPVTRAEGMRGALEHGKNTARSFGNSSRGTQMVDVAISVIREAGKPVPIGDLLDAVLAAGFTLGGADQKSNLAGYLSRDPRVASRGRNVGWDIIENEEAASKPGSTDAASSSNEGGTNERTTLAFPDVETDPLS